MRHSINVISEELARQVKRHREKRRKRREARVPGAVGTTSNGEPEQQPAAGLG
jgi:putative sigma-54 modulation protein